MDLTFREYFGGKNSKLKKSILQVGREEPIFRPGDTLSGRASVVIVGTLRFKVGKLLLQLLSVIVITLYFGIQ